MDQSKLDFPPRANEGRRLRDSGMASVDANEAERWKRLTDAVIRTLARMGEPFTAEDVRIAAGDPPHHPNSMGARFAYHVKNGTIERIGIKNATRKDAHACRLMIYRGAL